MEKHYKIDTLHFVLDDDILTYSYESLVGEIAKQMNNFYDKFERYPLYINMEEKIYCYLQAKVREMVTYSIDCERIYGMIIKTRDNAVSEELADWESICL